jgi:uncharacterized protein (DUF427 family)
MRRSNMKRVARHLLLTSLVFGGVAGAGQRPQDFTVGMEALTRGDYAIAYCRWLPLAERGYAEAQYNVGWLYANGNGLAVDIGKALSWWQRAARQGHADAQFAVGLAYTTGEGVKRDLSEAVTWYLAAARLGHADARDILLRLNGDPSLDLLAQHPALLQENWFGWVGRVLRDRINVRQGPGTHHAVVAQLSQDTSVRIIGQRGDWWKVVIDDDGQSEIAWIYKTLVKSADS